MEYALAPCYVWMVSCLSPLLTVPDGIVYALTNLPVFQIVFIVISRSLNFLINYRMSLSNLIFKIVFHFNPSESMIQFRKNIAYIMRIQC